MLDVAPLLDLSRHRLYERDNEINLLRQLNTTIHEQDCPAQICFVHGCSGTGKTSVCKYLKDEIKGGPVLFVEGKFDQYQDFSAPYSAVVEAFDSLGECLLSAEVQQADLIDSIRECLVYEGSILAQLIPSFARLVRATESEEEKKKKQEPERIIELANERLAVAFRVLLRMVCTPSRPLILFIDDLQWCDLNSLSILEAIVDDPETTNLLFLGGYRDEEETRIQSFLDTLRAPKQRFTDVLIRNLDISSVHALVSDVLCSSQHCGEQTSELSNLVFQKTAGNPYFVLQFLGILQRQGLLHYDSSMDAWGWDMERIRMETDESENVAYLVAKRIQILSPDIRRILKLAACLGYTVSIELLEILDGREKIWQRTQRLKGRLNADKELFAIHHTSWNNLHERNGSSSSLSIETFSPDEAEDHSDFQKALERAQIEGLIECKNGTCKFSHDRVQQCVYESIPPVGKTLFSFHYRTGRHILETCQGSPSQNQLLFLAADQCNRGSVAIKNDEERLDLVQLNLNASQAARTKAGVALIANFLDKAIELIKDSDWEGLSYELVLEVYNLSAEVEAARGKYDRSNGRLEMILSRAKCPADTVRAIAVRALSLGAQQDYSSALSEARKALALLGVKVPKFGWARLMNEILKMKRVLTKMSKEDFLQLPPMRDSRMVLAMRILQMGVVWGWNVEIYFGSMCYLTMMKLTLDHGLCHLAGFTFAGFGNIVANFLQNECEAYWFGQLACQVDAGREGIPATTMVFHCYLSHLRLPVSASLEPFLSAYRISLETGDLAMGTICLCNYIWVYKFCGLPLGPFSRDLPSFLDELRLCQQEYLLAFLLPDFHLALNLCGNTEDPSDISWNAIHESDLFTYKTVISKEHPAELNLLYTQMFNALVLGDLEKIERALHCVLARKKVFRRFDGSHIANQFFIFWDGLSCLALLRRRVTRRYRRLANQSIRWFIRASESGSINCVGMLQFLKAEKASVFSSTCTANVQELYNSAISQLSRTGFTHYGALANERAGEFMHQRGDPFWSELYLSQAATLYRDWGASVKVNQLQETYPFIRFNEDEAYEGVSCSVRARSRYDSRVDSLDYVSRDISSEFLQVDRQ